MSTRAEPEPVRAHAAASVAIWVGLMLVIGGISVVAWLLYLAPEGHRSSWGWNAPGARHFAAALTLPQQSLAPADYVGWFTLNMLLAWAGFALLLIGLARCTGPSIRILAGIGVPWLVALALLAPPTLSQDIYAYAAYARMPLLHDMNPYVSSQLQLRTVADATVPFLQWDITSPYGPLWTLFSVLLLAPFQASSLYLQVVLFKGVAIVSVLVVAGAVAAMAHARGSGSRNLAFAAILFNPLFIVEGAVSGHNDLFMLAFLAGAALCVSRDRERSGYLLLGLSVAAKMVTAVVLPWFLIRTWRNQIDRDNGGRARDLAILLGLFAAPILLSQIPFYEGGSFLGGLGAHMARQARKPLGAAMIEKAPAAICLAVATWWVVRTRTRWAWHDAWVGGSFGVMLFGAGIWFPWYLTWPLCLSLARWDMRGAVISGVLLSLAAFLMLHYGFYPPWASP